MEVALREQSSIPFLSLVRCLADNQQKLGESRVRSGLEENPIGATAQGLQLIGGRVCRTELSLFRDYPVGAAARHRRQVSCCREFSMVTLYHLCSHEITGSRIKTEQNLNKSGKKSQA